MRETADNGVGSLLNRLRDVFESGRTRRLSWRRQQLRGIEAFVREHEKEIVDALHADVGKPALESLGSELLFVRSEASDSAKRLSSWAKPEGVSVPIAFQPGKAMIVPEPKGVVLIIGPWNYPIQLILSPLIGALAAGNCAMVKPSEIAPETSRLIARHLPNFVDPEAVCVVEGGVSETTSLLEERFDHIFYTGNGNVGRIVMMAAAKYLTPITLELGGKSPCIVDASADIEVSARRILWGKFFNAGQTCVAPDYVLVHESIRDAFLAQCKNTLLEFYGEEPKFSPDYARIVNRRHHQRLCTLLESGDILVGGQVDEEELFIAPTLLDNVPLDSPAMSEEIFGPILPILSFQHVEEAIRIVGSRPKPLALYVFARDEEVQRKVLENTSSGGATVNHVWLHLGVPGLPFGGVGESGMGAYHGRFSFDTFSHRRSVLVKSTLVDPSVFYPPYSESKARWLRRLL